MSNLPGQQLVLKLAIESWDELGYAGAPLQVSGSAYAPSSP